MQPQKILEYDCYFCDRCRVYVYDENTGDPERRVWPQTLVEQLPSTWRCPVCGAEKTQLRGSTLSDSFTWKYNLDILITAFSQLQMNGMLI